MLNTEELTKNYRVVTFPETLQTVIKRNEHDFYEEIPIRACKHSRIVMCRNYYTGETLRYRVECPSFYPGGFINTQDMKTAHSFFETLQNLYG